MLINSEWILLAVLALVLLKPDDIPTIVRAFAQFVRQARQLWQLWLNEIDSQTISGSSGSENSGKKLTKHPFHIPLQGAKSQPLKD